MLPADKEVSQRWLRLEEEKGFLLLCEGGQNEAQGWTASGEVDSQ